MLTFWSPRVAWPPLTPSYSACPEGVRALCCAGSWQPPPSPPCSPFPPKAWQGPCAAAAPGGGCTGKSSWCHSWLCWSSWPAGSCSSSPRHCSPGGSWGCLLPPAGLRPLSLPLHGPVHALNLPHVNIIPVYSRGGVWKKIGPFEERNWTINTCAICMSHKLLFSSKWKISRIKT